MIGFSWKWGNVYTAKNSHLFKVVENRMQQCCAAHIVHSCQQYCSALLSLNQPAIRCNNAEQYCWQLWTIWAAQHCCILFSTTLNKWQFLGVYDHSAVIGQLLCKYLWFTLNANKFYWYGILQYYAWYFLAYFLTNQKQEHNICTYCNIQPRYLGHQNVKCQDRNCNHKLTANRACLDCTRWLYCNHLVFGD